MERQQTNRQDSGWIIDLAVKHKWILLISFLGGMILVYLASLTLPDNYESTAVVYAAGYDPNHQMEMKEGNTLLLMAFLESNDLRDSVISAFNLAGHYEVEKNGDDLSAAYGKYASNISFSRTINKSVRISVRDEDPVFAARLANGIVRITNAVKHDILQRSTTSSLKKIKAEYRNKQEELDTLLEQLLLKSEESVQKKVADLQEHLKTNEAAIESLDGDITALRQKHKVYDLNEHFDHLREIHAVKSADYMREKARLNVLRQSRGVHDSSLVNAGARVKGLEKEVAHLEQEIEAINPIIKEYNELKNKLSRNRSERDRIRTYMNQLLSSGGNQLDDPALSRLKQDFHAESARLRELKKRYEEALASYEQDAPAAYLISKAVPATHPAYPKRKFYALGGGILTLLFAFGVLLILDRSRGNRL